MKVYSISDFHLSIDKPKPMNVFGSVWDNYRQEIVDNCKSSITTIFYLLPGI